LVNEVERALTASNMRIVNESFGVTEDNARMFGLLQVANCQETKDYAYVIGLRGAIDKSLSRGLAVGSSVFVCDNMAFSSEIVMHRKQTKNILEDLPLMVDTAIGQLSAKWNDQGRRIDTYKQTAIGNKDAAYLLMEMAGDVFPAQKLPDIYAEFKNPRHAEFGKENLWAMFNAVTEFLKPKSDSKASGLWTMPARTGRLHKMCDDFAGLVIDVTATEVTPRQLAVAAAIAPSAPMIADVSGAIVPQ
jgi:CheY-specific phosphatase CheX